MNLLSFLSVAAFLGIIGGTNFPQTSYDDNKCSCPAHVGPTGSEWIGSCSAQCPTDMAPTCVCEKAKNSCTCEKK